MLILPAGSGKKDYNLIRSLRLRKSASAYLSRTNSASPTDYRKCTLSTMLKRGELGVNARIIDCDIGGNQGLISFNTSDQIVFGIVTSGSFTTYLQTNNVFRDPAAHYHIIFSADTSLGSNQFRLYVNGVEASYSVNTVITVGYGIYLNSASAACNIGRSATYGMYLDGLFAETVFVDGQALTPSSFGELDTEITTWWKPKKYTGSYGTNGFILNFEDNSAATAAAIGKDSSGNGNNWTPNNISLTAGATYDSMTDVPTLTSATAATYCTFNPLAAYGASGYGAAPYLSNGNMDANRSLTGGQAAVFTTMLIPPTGKYYFEVNPTSWTGYMAFNLCNGKMKLSTYGYSCENFIQWSNYNGIRRNDGTIVNATLLAANTVQRFAIDRDNDTAYFYQNNTLIYTLTGLAAAMGLTTADSIGFCVTFDDGTNGGTAQGNWGQRPFAYTPPTGFVALNKYNLPDGTIKEGKQHFNIALDTGANIKAATEGLFPSNFFEWIKDRANSNNHQLIDIVRGSSAVLEANTTSAETTYTAPSGNSVGFAWKAGGAPVINTAGSITSQVSANPAAGLSICTFTAQPSGSGTFGHGLGVTPALVIAKPRSSPANGLVYHRSIGPGSYLLLENTTSAVADSTIWNAASPNASVVTLGSWFAGKSCVAYCFAPIAGYSDFGAFSGNASADGTFIYTGFKPRFIELKNASAVESWNINDAARSPYNLANNLLFCNAVNGDTLAFGIDIVSNGFKIRNTGSQSNGSGNLIIYAAYAEMPFKYANAR